jgi:hypothetical protein
LSQCCQRTWRWFSSDRRKRLPAWSDFPSETLALLLVTLSPAAKSEEKEELKERFCAPMMSRHMMRQAGSWRERETCANNPDNPAQDI